MSRILLVTNIFPPQIGGPASFIDRLGHALAELGHRVTVICSSDLPTDPDDKLRPFRVHRISASNQTLANAKTFIVLFWEMLRHKHIFVNGLEYPAALAARFTGRRYILKIVGDTVWETARNSGRTVEAIEEFQKQPPQDGYLKRLADWRHQSLNRARLIVAPSLFLRRLIEGWGIEGDKIRVILNGVRLDLSLETQPGHRSSRTLRIAFAGRMTNWKGVETLLLALQKCEDIRATLIGDGPELPILVELADQLKINQRVKFTGRLPQAQLNRELRDQDVLVLVSSYEGLSHTLLEASALGLAIIASDRGGNPEVVQDGLNGLVVPYGNVEALTQALQLLRDDEDLRYRLASAARENSRRFDFNKTVEETISCILS